MGTASASPVYRSDAHRRAVMQHIGATLAPVAILYALLGPLVGLALIWGSTFVAMLCDIASTGGASAPLALAAIWSAVVDGYAASAMAAAITGVWVALLSPFAPDNPRFYSGSAIVGMMAAFLFVSVDTAASTIFGGQLFLALVGAVTAFLCAWAMKDGVLKRDEMRRDALARDRAERLARERAAKA